ncbi:hypothetical protein OK074_7295 [Actinobacteria bacterium OK074]|nr:hypothetical protein OK074_7295 [Actinobacteria bacterium OK074]
MIVQQPPPPTQLAPTDIARLFPRLLPRQQMGIDCVLCARRLGTTGRVLGDVRYLGCLFRLWACAPGCAQRLGGGR